MLALDAPSFRLQMRIDCGDSGTQCFVIGDENNICVVSYERFDVIDRGERAAERIILNQTGGNELVRSTKDINERDRRGFVGHGQLILTQVPFGESPL